MHLGIFLIENILALRASIIGIPSTKNICPFSFFFPKAWWVRKGRQSRYKRSGGIKTKVRVTRGQASKSLANGYE